MKLIIILLLSCFTLFSCVNNVRVNKENDVTDAGIPDKNIIESVSPYSGEYKGILPCADCPGIETTLTLEKDGNFALHLVYIDEKDGIFDE